ncbi:MAG: hypothetical protein WAK19_05200 [Candidatus Cybelea sp.]
MSFSNRAAILLVGMLLAVSACSSSGTMPATAPGAVNPASQVSGFDSPFNSGIEPDTTTSILKTLKTNVVIGSTVDPTNGDKGGHSVSVVTAKFGFKAGQVLVCNFEDKTGKAGAGTTLDVFDPTPGSKPVTVSQSSKLEGCSGSALTSINGVYLTAPTSGLLVPVNNKGKLGKAVGAPYKEPFSDVDASDPGLYAAEYIFGSDASTGGIISFSINDFGNKTPLEPISGFAVNHKTGWSMEGPGGLVYQPSKPNTDTLFVADAIDNTVVAFNNASELLLKDEVVVKKGGKTFDCKYPKTTCGTLIHSGKPLDGPVAMTLLPNGNLIIANTNNTLVELTTAGKVLDTEVVDKTKTPGIFGVAAATVKGVGTVLFYTDANSNDLHKLEP